MQKKLWITGLLFSVIPIAAILLDYQLFRDIPESFAVIVYLPFLACLLGQMGSTDAPIIQLGIVVIGAGITLGIWFGIGLAMALLANAISHKNFQMVVGVMFIFVFYIAVILPAQLERAELAMSYEIIVKEDEQRRIIGSSDPSIDPSYCNSIDSYDLGRDCWTVIAKRPNTTPVICDSAIYTHDKSRCLQEMAVKLQDSKICESLYGDDYNRCRTWICSSIENASKKSACWLAFEQEVLSKGEDCEPLRRSDYWKPCIETVAIRYHNDSWCNNLLLVEDIQSCKKNFAKATSK